MYTIYHNSADQGHGFESFKENFIEICNQHREQDRAMGFAFILYDFENPHLRKILSDQDYWDALDKVSGKYLTVFSLHTIKKRRDRSGPGPNDMSYMTSFAHLQEPSQGYQEIFEKYFSFQREPRYPAILFFQVDKEKVIDAALFELNERKIEEAFLELKKFIDIAAGALKKISADSKGNLQEIFNQVKGDAENVVALKDIKSGAKTIVAPVGVFLKILGMF